MAVPVMITIGPQSGRSDDRDGCAIVNSRAQSQTECHSRCEADSLGAGGDQHIGQKGHATDLITDEATD